MIELENIKRIVFYGCSFTVGSELSDQELMPHLSREEIDKLKIKEMFRFYDRFDPKEFPKLDHQKSWTRWFSDELNLPWDNRAKGGSSMGQIIFSIEEDLANGKILDTDMIVVGITSPERICTFQNYGTRSYIMHDFDTSWDKKFRTEFILNIANDDYILYNWYKDINYLDLLSTRLNGRLYQQWVWATLSEIFRFKNNGVPFYSLKDYVTKVVNESVTFKSIINNDFSFSTLQAWSPENKEALGHPKLELHQKFGKFLAQKFLENHKFKG